MHALEISSSLAWFALVTTFSTWSLALAYRNTKFQLKHRVAVRREDAVAREMSRKLADDKKMSRKEKDERSVLVLSQIITGQGPVMLFVVKLMRSRTSVIFVLLFTPKFT